MDSGAQDGDTATGKVATLLGRGTIHSEGDKVGPDLAVAEEGDPAARGTVSDHQVTSVPRLPEEADQPSGNVSCLIL